MVKRNKCRPKLTMPFWVANGNGYRAAKKDLLDAIIASGRTSDELNRRMGVGISNLCDALEGETLDLWSAYYVDCALRPDPPASTSHSYPPVYGTHPEEKDA